MDRLIPAIIAAWRAAERDLTAPPDSSDALERLVNRVDALRSAHGMALARDASRDAVVRFLQEHDAGDVVAAADQSRGVAADAPGGEELRTVEDRRDGGALLANA